MEEFLHHFFGNRTAGFHVAGLIFCLIGALGYKYHVWHRHKAQAEGVGPMPVFSRKVWFNENWDSVLMSVLGSFVFVRFLDILLHWLSPKIEAAFGFGIPTTDDQVFYYLFAGTFIQWWIHKQYDKKKK